LISLAGEDSYTETMKRLSILLLATAVSLRASAAALHPALPSSVVPDGLGVNIHFTDARPGEMEMLATAGFHWVRMDFSWSGTEKERGKYDFSAYDRLLAALDAQKMRALFILDYGNKLYEPDRAVATEEGRRAFAAWAAAAATHFKGHGILWEIWNEPNISFWQPKPNADDYAALALATAKAIRAAAPGEAVIGPATSGVDLKFIESCFKAGLLEWWDAVSVHPYRQSGPEGVDADYQKLRRLIAQYAPKDKAVPILSGEWGYSAAWNSFDAAKQGTMLSRQWLVNLANHIPLSIWYDWHDDGNNPKESEHHFGTVAFDYHAGSSPVYEPKPAYLAAKTLASVLGGCQFTKRLALGDQDDYALLFAKGNELRLAVWTASAAPHAMKIPASPGEFEVIAHTGEKLASVSAKNNELVLTASAAPQYLIPKQPNAILGSAPAAHPLRASLAPVGGKLMAVQIENLGDSPFTGTVRLTGSGGFDQAATPQTIEFGPGETQKLLTFPFVSAAGSDVRAGLRIESKGGVMFERSARRFLPVRQVLFAGCRIVPDGDSRVASRQSIAVAPAPQPWPGLAAVVLKMTYRCDDGWKFFRVVPAGEEGREIDGEPKAFGLWIHGDGQRASPRLRVVDAARQTWQPAGDEIDWVGWRFVEFEFQPSAAHWGGANDGVIHFPLRWDSLFLLDNVQKRKSEGTLCIAAPVLIY
jgi:hypothetical protein